MYEVTQKSLAELHGFGNFLVDVAELGKVVELGKSAYRLDLLIRQVHPP